MHIGVRIRFLAFNKSAPRTPLWAQNAHPRTRIDCPSGVEGGIMYTDVGCNVYFDFSLRMNERKITSHSGHAILAAQIARSVTHQLIVHDQDSIMSRRVHAVENSSLGSISIFLRLCVDEIQIHHAFPACPLNMPPSCVPSIPGRAQERLQRKD